MRKTKTTSSTNFEKNNHKENNRAWTGKGNTRTPKAVDQRRHEQQALRAVQIERQQDRRECQERKARREQQRVERLQSPQSSNRGYDCFITYENNKKSLKRI